MAPLDKTLATSYELSIVGLTVSICSGLAAIFNGIFQDVAISRKRYDQGYY